MKLSPVLLILAVTGICCCHRIWSADAQPAPASKVAPQVLQRLADMHRLQVEKLDQLEILRQDHTHPNAFPPLSHTFVLRLGNGVEVVTERHMEDNVVAQKDYFLNDSRVYAYRVTRHDPSPDGKTKRVSESQFLFDNGSPVYNVLVAVRVPVSENAPSFAKATEKVLPIPAGLEGWGHKLTVRAFDIARSFKPGIGRYAFGDWDAWLLKKAPPQDKTPQTQEDRPKDWLPLPDTLVLPIADSLSPDGLYEIGWGYEKGPVDWKKLAFMEGPDDGPNYPTFSTKLADGPLTPELENDGDFLMNRISGKTLAKLDMDYPGERQRFNHDELIAHWSPSSACFLVRAEQKWFTEYAQVGWIKDGACAGVYDVLEVLKPAAEDAVKKSKHPAGTRLKKTGDEAEDYMFTLSKMLLEDDGKFEAHVMGTIPKDPEPSGFYEAIIEGAFSPGEKDGPAKLKVSKTRVLPVRKDG
ncbi:hypothetical protein DES53_113166 [Roseimicrobium gellanilyticum]|uniref:Uncharacterized protein n=1 Tax=Roseimicrobium gellanilyticum TaxID=748857 RepID=A0A366H6Z8_9BACT|nr:hypothetical protein [Roseimicrobium gellanilyticum]RBP37783.1 hypothetical protein DES53_113166 [Roseimicrobium gellanilyticum]